MLHTNFQSKILKISDSIGLFVKFLKLKICGEKPHFGHQKPKIKKILYLALCENHYRSTKMYVGSIKGFKGRGGGQGSKFKFTLYFVIL